MRILGPDFKVNSTLGNAEAHPAIAGLSIGGFVATWMSEDGAPPPDRQIRARLFDANGVAVAPDFIINTTTVNDQITPAVAATPNSSYLVTWSSLDGGDGSGASIRARFVNTGGITVFNDFIVNSTTAGDQAFPAVTLLGNTGTAVYTWSSAVGSDYEIRARVFFAGGGPLGPDFVVNSTTADAQSHPAVAGLVSGNFFAEAWRSADGADGSSGCIRVRVFNPDGTPVASDFVANTTTAGDQFDPAITGLPDGHFVVTWTSSDGGDGQGDCIRARLFDGGGNPVGADFIVNTTTAGNQNSAAIVALANGQFVVTWVSDTGDGSGTCIMARLFNANGTPVGNDFLVDTTIRANQFQPTITTEPDGNVVIAWMSDIGAAPLFAEVKAIILDPTPAGGKDFTGDATGDVLWRHSGGQVSEWLINDARVGDSRGVATPDLAWHFQDTGDFNADLRSDILWRHDNGQVVLWQMDGSTILSNQSVATLGNDWHNEGAGDLTGDGRADVLWRNDNGQVALWTMNGAQITNNQLVATVGANWHFQGLLDANGDGKSDVLLRDSSGQVVLWTMNGAQIVNNQSVANLGLDWNIVGTGDFNNDGRGDVLLRHDSGQVVIWQMKGAQIVSNTSVATPGTEWHVQDVGDYNRDGRSDVLLRHDNGQVVMWEMNGATIASNHAVLHQGGQPATIGLDWTVLTHQYDVL